MPVIVKRNRQIKRYYRYRVRKAYELMYNELKKYEMYRSDSNDYRKHD